MYDATWSLSVFKCAIPIFRKVDKRLIPIISECQKQLNSLSHYTCTLLKSIASAVKGCVS